MKLRNILRAVIALVIVVSFSASLTAQIDTNKFQKPNLKLKLEDKGKDNTKENSSFYGTTKEDSYFKKSDFPLKTSAPYMYEKPAFELQGLVFTSHNPYVQADGYGGHVTLAEGVDKAGTYMGGDLLWVRYTYAYNPSSDFPNTRNVSGVANEFVLTGLYRLVDQDPYINYEEFRAGVKYADEKDTTGWINDVYSVRKQKTLSLFGGYRISMFRDDYRSFFRQSIFGGELTIPLVTNSETFIRGVRQDKSETRNKTHIYGFYEQDWVGWKSFSFGSVIDANYYWQDYLKIVGIGFLVRTNFRGTEPFKIIGKVDLNLNSEEKDNMSFSLTAVVSINSTWSWAKNKFHER